MKKETSFQPLRAEDTSQLVAAFAAASWNKPPETFKAYYKEQSEGKRFVWVAWVEGQVAGYVTLIIESKYPPFAEANIPEINDLNVLPQYQGRHIGTQLLNLAEEQARATSARVGIGVGLYRDYGTAQRIYARRGYLPDGKGITYDYKRVAAGSSVPIDDDLILWWIKDFSRQDGEASN